MDAEDLKALLECELQARLERGWRSLRRRRAGGELQARLLHGRMDVILDVIRAELVRRGVRRGALALSPEEPARVLLGGPAEGGGP